MGQIYKVPGGFSEGFFTWMSEDEKSRFLAERGITIMYDQGCRHSAIYFDSSADTEESRMNAMFADEVWIRSSEEELQRDLQKCFMAVGFHENEPQLRRKKE